MANGVFIKTKPLVLLSLVSGLFACADNETTYQIDEQTFIFSATNMINNLTDNIIVAGYVDLSEKAELMLQASQTLVATPTQANLLAAQNAWKAARIPWEQGEATLFGPVDALGIDPHLDTWPLNTTDLQTVLDENINFDADTIRTWNDDVQGFHAMEYLLFGDGITDNTKDIAEMTAKERDYLMALAEVFRDYSVILDDAWQVSYDQKPESQPYAEILKNPSEDNPFYHSPMAVAEELINGMIGIVDEVANGKMAEPLGSSIATANTGLVESQYSWNSLADFNDNIKGVRNVYQGEKAGNKDNTGIVDLVKAADPALSVKITDEIDDAIAKIEAIAGENNMYFRQAILDNAGRARVQTAIDALHKLQATLESQLLPLLQRWQQ